MKREMQKFRIISINTSEKNGTIKKPVGSALITPLGVDGDSHAGNWHRQISLLGLESYRKVRDEHDLKLEPGAFAENLTTEGLTLHHCRPMDRFINDGLELEVTQIGKKCHSGCEIQKQTGDCVMPREGIFCKVIRGGQLKEGDELEYHPRLIRVHILTLSDRAAAGEYEDRSGPEAEKLLAGFFDENLLQHRISRNILPDDREAITRAVEDLTGKSQARTKESQGSSDTCDILITTGGTGIGPRDFTPDVIRPLMDKEIPGIMELIRTKYGASIPNALLSRSIAGVAGQTLVYVLPGSVKAVREYLAEITPTLEHSLRMLHGIDSH